MPLHPGDLLAAKYRIEGEIGRGAFGRVYRARDVKLDRVVAIKELVKGADDVGSTLFADYERRFRREARVQARFNHPNIVHVYELLEEGPDRLYLVMEYVDGESLRDYLARRGPLPIEEAVRIMADILAGLAEVHADPRDIVHRDIKPSNVLLTKGGQAKLTDFGLAQVADESMRSGSGGPHPGTPAYMSPEQETTNAYLYPASDIFSAGCVLFELLTGVPYKQARRRRQGLLDLRPDVPAWLAEVVAALLAREAEERPADGAEAAARLREGERQRIETDKRMAAEDQARAKTEVKVEAKARAEPRAPAEGARGAAQPSAAAGVVQVSSNELALALAPGVQMAFVRVPAGEFLMGSDKGKDRDAFDDEQPQHRVYLDEYWIDKYPVTVAQFAAFVEATGYKTTAEERGSGWAWTGSGWEEVKGANWRQPRGPGSNVQGKADHPVTQMSWHDAVAFCEWASRVTGQKIRLPTEAEWEKAARGTDGRLYPWGNQPPTEKLCNFDENVGDTTPVGRYSPAGDSPYGCADMAGNVWEWCGDWYDILYYAGSPPRNPPGPGTGQERVVRGGSWYDGQWFVRAAVRDRNTPDCRDADVGFRCALSP